MIKSGSAMDGICTSPAPRNKNVFSAKVPPTKFSADMSPARTTDAVPCKKAQNRKMLVTASCINHTNATPTSPYKNESLSYLNVIIENKVVSSILCKKVKCVMIRKVFKLVMYIMKLEHKVKFDLHMYNLVRRKPT